MVEETKDLDVELSFENHTGSIGERPDDILAILEGAPGLRLDCDLSHLVACAVAASDTAPLIPYVHYIALRNAISGNFNRLVENDQLDFDVRPYFALLAGVDRYSAVEYYEPGMRQRIVPLK